MYFIIKSFILASVLTLTFSISLIYAQSVSGTVQDAQTGEPLAGANIIQAGTNNGTATDSYGRFTFSLSQSGKPVIRVSFVGYKTTFITIAGQDTTLDVKLAPQTIFSNAIFVEALRVDKTTPIAYENIDQAHIKEKNFGRDIPYLLSSTPSVTTSSDAGAGIGYTGIRIRGIDPTRINITINGIPLNDAESQGVFFVDIPDLASSVQNMQVQRGVGTSTNGAGAFGASINLQTYEMRPDAYGEINAGGGSFNTRRFNVNVGSGLLDDGWQVEGRLSKINSDGYIDRAFSDLKSFYLSAAHHGKHSLLRADVFSGKERTYQAYYGVPEAKLQTDRTYNPAGMEKPGAPYKNQTDNYQQDHYQLHYSYQLTDNWEANASLHYTYGRGYYEEYKADQPLANYGIGPVILPDTTISQSDLVRQLWLDNDFYGTVFSTRYHRANWKLTVGGGYNEYKGRHFGELVQTEFGGPVDNQHHYYDNNAFKTDGNLYAKLNYAFTKSLNGYVDMQVRHITYNFLGKDLQKDPTVGQDTVDVDQDARLTFFNPKMGAVYRLTKHQRVYASLSVGHKEPGRDEYVNSTPENRPDAEALYDYEAGYKVSKKQFTFGANAYYMRYDNQLIPTGEINDVGNVVLQNVPDSYRAGIELQGGVRITPALQWSVNATLSRNKIDRYTQFLDNYDTGGQVSKTYSNTDISFSPSFIGNSIVDFTQHGFTAELTTKYVSRQYLDNTQTQSRSLDPYIVNNLLLSYDLGDITMVKDVKVSVQINNIFNEVYESKGYTFGDVSGGKEEHFNYYFPQAGRNFLARLSIGF